ncbi:EcsC family protein [Halogeometricum limi]|uniref:EcsC family protein n=1 Tax=Halogeometricum limi TaxID=555875 RepID=UPI0015874D6F|nr:EcsC family protein [Halogeometricum limi]
MVEPNRITETLEKFGSDATDAIRSASRYDDTEEWVVHQARKSFVAGAGAGAVPGAYWVLGPVDVIYLVRTMMTTAWGVGVIRGCSIDAATDLALILAVWSGHVDPADVRMQLARESIVEFRDSQHGVSRQFLKKVSTKVAAKIGAKVAGKVVGHHIPVVGPIACGGVNAYFVRSIADVAEHYYAEKEAFSTY